MIFIILFVICLFVIILLFASPRFSPIPYFPTQKKDLPLIIKNFKLKNGQIIYDLGAGDGTVIFEAAKTAFERKLNTKFVAIEINPVLILILQIRKFLHPNRNNIKIIWKDLFDNNWSLEIGNLLGIGHWKLGIVFYLYVSPWLLEKIIKKLKLKIKNFSVVSYMYPIKSLKRKEKIIKGKNSIYLYNL